jgi:anti-sigma regulatory factor (Ser/Thr protein kinase)
MSAPDGNGYRHHALIYTSADELLAAAVPFLRAGLTRGEPAFLACRDELNTRLAEALDTDPRITFLPRAGIYRRTAGAVAAYQRLVRRELDGGARRVRVVREVHHGGDQTAWADWGLFEAVCNAALGPYPLSGVCAYDRRVLPEAIVSQAVRTHPQFLSPDGARQNDEYIQPACYLRDFGPERHDEDHQEDGAQPAYERVRLTRTREVAGLRAELLSTLIGAGVANEDTLEFVVAVHEVATNGLRHGVPPVSVQLWISRARLTCTVTDCGCGFDDPLVGYITDCGEPSRTNTTGLWLARLTTGTSKPSSGSRVSSSV